MARMKILTRYEVAEFESPPKFNSTERKQFFSVSQAINELLAILRTPTNQVCFLILVGYFKAKRKFFGQQFSQLDVEFVAHQVGVNSSDVNIESYSRETYIRHQRLILQHFGYQAFDEMARAFTCTEVQALVRVQHRPKLIFLEVVQVLTRKKITLPTYNLLADLIVESINQHLQTLGDIVEKSPRLRAHPVGDQQALRKIGRLVGKRNECRRRFRLALSTDWLQKVLSLHTPNANQGKC